MSTFNILFLSFVVAFIANLIHWHGSGRYFYTPETAIGRRVRVGVRIAVIALVIFAVTHIFPVDFVLDIFLALLVVQNLAMIWRRRRERIRSHATSFA